MTEHSTVTVNGEQKQKLLDAQEELEEELGINLTQGEAVKMLAARHLEGDE